MDSFESQQCSQSSGLSCLLHDALPPSPTLPYPTLVPFTLLEAEAVEFRSYLVMLDRSRCAEPMWGTYMLLVDI